MKFKECHQRIASKKRLIMPSPSSRVIKFLSLTALLCAASIVPHRATASAALDAQSADMELNPTGAQATSATSSLDASKSMPANHRMDSTDQDQQESSVQPDRTKVSSSRHGRQYDVPLSTSSTGNYAAVSGDAGAYVGSSLPLSGYNTAASSGMVNSAAYGSADSMGASSGMSAYPSGGYHDQMSMARGYPAMHSPAAYPPMAPFPGPSGSSLSSMFPGSAGLFSASSSGFPLMTKGFDIAEIVCTAIAVAIGAVIVGAPFILLYLFVMNQMQGNGPQAMGPGGGSISLTGPTASTNVGGRKKRHTSFPEALFRQLGPLINNEQVAQTFKALMNSIAKYQV